jgi:hypothetical protein
MLLHASVKKPRGPYTCSLVVYTFDLDRTSASNLRNWLGSHDTWMVCCCHASSAGLVL